MNASEFFFLFKGRFIKKRKGLKMLSSAFILFLMVFTCSGAALGNEEVPDGTEVELRDLTIKFLAIPEFEPTRYTKSNGGKFAPEEIEKGLLIGAEMKLGKGNPQGMMAPLKHSFADIAGEVAFDVDTGEIRIRFNGLTLEMEEGSDTAVLRSPQGSKSLEIPAGTEPYFQYIEGETTPEGNPYYVCYLPVQFTAQALGGTVTWDEQMHRLVMAFAFYYQDAAAAPNIDAASFLTTKKLEDDKEEQVGYTVIQDKLFTSGGAEEIIKGAMAVISPVYQNEDGGWAKTNTHYDLLDEGFMRLLTPGYSTFDNGSTHGQMRFLSRVIRLSLEYPSEFQGYGEELEKIETSFWKSVRYLLEAQDDEDGGWPQYYPYAIGYFKNITYNDNAMTTIMETLYALTNEDGNMDDSLCEEFAWAREAIENGGGILQDYGISGEVLQTAWDTALMYTLNAQVEVDGVLTGWAQQYDPDNDPVTGKPIPTVGRSYELPSIATGESVSIMRLLMNIKDPDEDIVNAIESFVEWTRQIGTPGYVIANVKDRTRELGTDRRLVKGSDTDMAFGRFYGLDKTGDYYGLGIENAGYYIIFSGRDGIAKLDHNIGGHERRSSYSFINSGTARNAQSLYEQWMLTRTEGESMENGGADND